MQLTSCDRSHHWFILFPLSSTISKIFEYLSEEEEKEEIYEISLCGVQLENWKGMESC